MFYKSGVFNQFRQLCGVGTVVLAVFLPVSAQGQEAVALPQIPDRPSILTVDEKSGLLYIFGQDNGEVLVTDPQNRMKPVFGTRMFEIPEDAVYDAAQNKIYELHYLAGILVVFDAKAIASGAFSGPPISRVYYLPDTEKGMEKNAMVLDAARNRLWILYTTWNTQTLYLFDTGREIVRKVMTLPLAAASVAVDPGSGDLFLQHAASSFITRINGTTFESKEVSLPDIAGPMFLDRVSKTLYILGPFSGKVFAYNIVAETVREISLGGVSASFVAGLPLQNRLYAVSKFGKPNVSVVDTLSQSVIQEINLPSVPFYVFAADNLGLLGVVTAENTLLVLNSAGSVVRQFSLPPVNALGGLWTNPRIPAAYDPNRSAFYFASPQLNAIAKINLQTLESETYNWPPAAPESSGELEPVSGALPERDLMAPESILSVGGKIFVLNYGGFITVFDNRLYKTLRRIEVASTLNSMAFDGRKIYASSAYAKKVYRIDPDTYEVEKVFSAEGLPATFWDILPYAGMDRILVLDGWGGKFAFINTENGETEFAGTAGAGVIAVGYNERIGEAVFVTRERGILKASPEKKSVEEIVPLGRIADSGPYFVNTYLKQTDIVYLVYFDGKAQRVVGVNTAARKIVSDFSVGEAPEAQYDFVTSIVFNPTNNRVLVSFPGRLMVVSASGKTLKDFVFDANGLKVVDDGGRRGGTVRISRFWTGSFYDIYLNMGTKIMRVDPNTYDVSLPLETRLDDVEGLPAIGILGGARRILPDPETRKLYIIYNYDGMAIYDFATGRVWLRANPGLKGVSWSAYHIISPLSPDDKPQAAVPPWIARERNIRIAVGLGALLAGLGAGYFVFRSRRRSAKIVSA